MSRKKRKKRGSASVKARKKYPTSLRQTYIGRMARGSSLNMGLIIGMGLAGLALGVVVIVLLVTSGGG